MAEGWIKLNRSLQDHWLWKDEPYDKARAWIDLIMLANWEDKKTAYKGGIITCKRGDVNLSLAYLAKRWNWSIWKVRNYLQILEADGMVKTNCTTHRTTITIVNYGLFQDLPNTDNMTNCNADQKQTKTTKKDKKEKNIRSYSAAQNKFNQFQQNNYDFEEIERAIWNENK